jgi:ubiquinone/menaquinone biosynthesis C-methylase UbiE
LQTPDFDARAARYDELRPVDENWREVYEVLVREGGLSGQRVLDVGCGTGRFATALAEHAKVWGVDQASQMLEVARSGGSSVRFKEASAYELPFKDGWFDRVTMWLVVHLLERPRAYAEIRRVLAPGGRIAVATFDPSYFGLFWFRDYFPSMEAIDRARFPTTGDFEAELTASGFAAPSFTRISQEASVTREVALDANDAGTLDVLLERFERRRRDPLERRRGLHGPK